MAKKTSPPSIVFPLAVLLLGMVAYRVQRPRFVAEVAKERVAQDSVKSRIARLRGLSHQDTTALRRAATASEREIAAAEATIPETVDIPALMTNVDALAHRYRLTSGPLSPDSALGSANEVAAIAAPYGTETYRVTVAGTWGDVVGFLDALPSHAGRIITVPAIRSLVPSRAGDGTLTADIGISVVTRHAAIGTVNPVQVSGPAAAGSVPPGMPGPTGALGPASAVAPPSE